jgi:hypothetical protein
MDEHARWIVWVVGLGVVTALGLFFRGLIVKIDNAISRREFNDAMKSMREEHQADRREWKDAMIRSDAKLDTLTAMTHRSCSKIDLIAQKMGFEKTWPGFRADENH